MKREDLKKLGLEDEAIESVMKLHGQTVNGLQEQVTALQASEANLKSQNEKHEKDLKTLQKDNDDIETLKQTITLHTDQLLFVFCFSISILLL